MALDMEAKKIIVKTWTTVSGLRTAQADRGRHEADQKEDKWYAVPRGSQFSKYGLGKLRKGEVIPQYN
ncbi:hypothetical protein T4E_4520 [Trichinella pseudospiralis]|uniref:Uncharacterized protein n=1 Tax=Trichinella pseudospiralis TaxID=6337 RepID=A0A0V0YBE1_TRIPS|nr:hypothetical protein T4E_4520 [Trichinella pseudospiralis]